MHEHQLFGVLKDLRTGGDVLHQEDADHNRPPLAGAVQARGVGGAANGEVEADAEEGEAEGDLKREEV